jgi:NAD(P) transhydrogenase subunit alpha
MVGMLEPYSRHDSFRALQERRITAFALELLPRITKAQSMDVLSSMASVAGYKAALIAANKLPKMLPMLMTAAGTVVPSKVLVIGAGVAGLQAIATAHRMGAVVSSYDIRPAVREQVESLGAKFIALDLDTAEAETQGGYAKAMGEEFYRRQRELMADIVRQADAVITTAAVPGKKAPVLITEEMVRGMPSGSLIVDLAAERGGNCECTRAGEEVDVNGVRVIGPLNLAASVPYHASQLYSKNVTTFLQYVIQDGDLQVDGEDEIVKSTLVTHAGNLVHEQNGNDG